MRCTHFVKTQSIVALFAVFLGGFFSSLRGATIIATPADLAAKLPTAKPGDTVLLRGGTYGKISSSPNGTSWTSAVTIKAYSGEKATVRKVGLQGNFQYIIFEDLFVDGENSGSGGNESVYLAGGANHIRFLRCDISRGLTHGVLIPHPGSDYNEFIQSRLHHNVGVTSTGTRQYGIYSSARYTLLDGCEIDNNGSYGVHFYNGYAGERADGQIVRNSRIHDNGRDDPAAAGVILSSGSGMQAISNEIWNNPRGLDVAWRNPVNAVVRQNKISSSGANINIEATASGTTVESNCAEPAKIVNNGNNTKGLSPQTNGPGACSGSTSPPPPTEVDVTQQQPPPTSQPSGPSVSDISTPFLIAGVIVAALLFSD